MLSIFKQYLLVGTVLTVIGILWSLGKTHQEAKVKQEKIEAIRLDERICLTAATAGHVGAMSVLIYQTQNRFLIYEDYRASVDYADLRLSQYKRECLEKSKKKMEGIK